MPIRPIILYPDPRLKAMCRQASGRPDAHSVARDLLDTMNAGPPRTVGIAAPQIGSDLRIAIVDTSRNPKYPPGHGLAVLIDPVIAESDGVQIFREGCLSIPDFTANIHRAMRVQVNALDLEGRSITMDADGFEAVVLQHEIDHLDGLLFLDRVRNIHEDIFRRK